MSEDDEEPEPIEPEPEPVEPEPMVSELEPELIVPAPPELPGELELPDVPERDEPAPEPAPEPMLPELLSPPEERLLPLPEVEPADFCHFWNSDCDSEPSLLASAVLNAPLSWVCIAASVCEMRPSRFASSELNDAVPEAPEAPEAPELDAPEALEPGVEPAPVPCPIAELPPEGELLLPELPWLDDEPDVPLPWLWP
ncbi:MAG: hypothetical protein MUF07_15795 [Steroidobacteraceae bacterium]|nr:hypothetical protein [Steroidobacteraceae bacterium]